MRHQFVFGLAATLILGACSAPTTTPTPVVPDKPESQDSTVFKQETPVVVPKAAEAKKDVQTPVQPVQQQSPIATTTTPTVQTQTPNLIQNGNLIGANGMPLNINQLSTQIPNYIPQSQATQYLQPLNNFANCAPDVTPLNAGAYAGYAPGYANYGAVNNCLYYPYQGYYVPYTLCGDNYVPYFYNYANSYVYPMYYGCGDTYYPYFYYSDAFYGGAYGYWDNYYYRNRHHDRDTRGNDNWHNGRSQHTSGDVSRRNSTRSHTRTGSSGHKGGHRR